ncbi:MAG: FAD-binding protein [Desulfovibrio sp.]
MEFLPYRPAMPHNTALPTFDRQNHPIDVLVLGSGLGGMRAAWSAAQAPSRPRVALLTLAPGPSGSSFANYNRQLGMQVPLTDQEREDFVAEALGLARPGTAFPDLASLLAEQAEARLRDLQALGAPLLQGEDGLPLRRQACFSPHARAVILTDLARTHALLRAKLQDLNIRVFTGQQVTRLLPARNNLVGAEIHSKNDGSAVVRARAVVVALGGPAPLAERNIAGPGNPGQGWEMLASLGAGMENTDYLQYLWLNLDSLEFRSPAILAGADAVILTPDGREAAPSAKVLALADARRTHCPVAWGPISFQGKTTHDYGMDQWLQAHANDQGVVRVKVGKAPWEHVALFAQAGNGGARIDACARVLDPDSAPVPGFYACGECATGMHGANRLGGAMVAATQVFGHIAGQSAARDAAG